MTEDKDIRSKPERIQIAAAAAVLAAGILVYLLDRPGSAVYFVPNAWSTSDWMPSVFGEVGQYLPTFSHTFAFILFTTAVIGRHRRAAIIACVGWLVVDSFFEIAQIDALAEKLVQHVVPHWFFDWPILDTVATYFLLGRFDPIDLVSIFVACVAAYLVILYSNRKGPEHVA